MRAERDRARKQVERGHRQENEDRKQSGGHNLGPSGWWLLGYLTSKLNLSLLFLIVITFPHLLWNLLGERIQYSITSYQLRAMLNSDNWYLCACLALVWSILLAREVLFFFTESYRYDPANNDLICSSFRHRMENSISLALVYDVDISKASLLNYLTGTGHIRLKHSTPENRGATTFLLWVRNPNKVRDLIKSKSGVSNARFIVSV